MDNIDSAETRELLLGMLAAPNLGFCLSLCRLVRIHVYNSITSCRATWVKLTKTVLRGLQIMMPAWLSHEWSLYVCDMERTMITVLDPMYTEMTRHVYEIKHGNTVRTVLRGLKIIGMMMDDGWEMDITKWTVVYNEGMHVACRR